MEEKHKDSDAHRMEKLLSTHSLEGLVYEKRERKQSVNPFSSYTQSLQRNKLAKPKQKTKQKKQIKKLKRQTKLKQKDKQEKPKQPKQELQVKNTNLKSQQNLPLKKKGRPPKIKHQKKPQVSKQKQKEKSPQIKEESEQMQSEMDDESQQNASEYQISKKREQKRAKNQESQQSDQNSKQSIESSQKIIEKPTSIKQKQANQILGFKKFKKASSSQQKQKISSNQSKIVQQSEEEELKEDEKEKEKEKQLPRTHKITRVHSVTQLIDQQKNTNMNKSMSQREQNRSDNMEVENGTADPEKRVLRVRKINNFHEQPKQIEQNEGQRSSSSSKKKQTRLRRRKEDPLRKFNQLEDGSYEGNQVYTRRRKGGTDKQYQINRIFRKTQKANLPNVKLDVDIMKFPLQNFAQKFKDFDMIHCSLPLDMLIRLPNISSLISKGFMFVWAEKGQIQIGYHWLNRLGFDVIDQIVWTKTNKTLNQVICDKNTEHQIFPNSKSTCLVGYKCSSTQKTEYCTKISNNLIFATEENSTIQKPDQIYEIGDLMMPGARKLEIGYKQIGGWFTLKHREESLVRCNQCFRRGSYKLYMTKEKSAICQYCLDFNKRKLAEQEEEEQQKIQQKDQITTPDTLYPLQTIYQKFENTLILQCQSCQNKVLELIKIINPEDNGHKSLCKNCFTLPDKICQITVTKTQQAYFPSKSIKCSKCPKTRLYKYYYQCFTCKQDHVMCSSCFMQPTNISISPDKIEQQQQQQKSHDWRLKLINQFPETRAMCFTCNQQCSIPYWGCQICQNWYWCGRCECTAVPKGHPHHCHYFGHHELHLII